MISQIKKFSLAIPLLFSLFLWTGCPDPLPVITVPCIHSSVPGIMGPGSHLISSLSIGVESDYFIMAVPISPFADWDVNWTVNLANPVADVGLEPEIVGPSDNGLVTIHFQEPKPITLDSDGYDVILTAYCTTARLGCDDPIVTRTINVRSTTAAH